MKSKNVLHPNRKVRFDSLSLLKRVLTTTVGNHCAQYPWAVSCSGYIRNSDWSRLYEWASHLSTEVYETAEEHFAATQLSALILKYPWRHSQIGLPDPEITAKQKFVSAERKCSVTNRRLHRVLRSRYAKYIWRARDWIYGVIGEEPDLAAIYDQMQFSTGSNIGVHGKATNFYRKAFAKSWTVTPSCQAFAISSLLRNEQLVSRFTEWRGSYFCYDREEAAVNMNLKCESTTYNLISFVPKNAKTHRSIAIEPLLNSYVQKGIDTELRIKLKAKGIDLSDQSRNQRLAQIGSSDGSLCTVDLSSASDSVAIALVKLLLPPAWFAFLDQCRSPAYKLDGQISRYHKFVSMGNGFCFPLESLIFAALTRSVIHFHGSTCRTMGIYGDDIIAPNEVFDDLRKVLAFCGFSFNEEKSFNAGPFRESCGADWYEGRDVRPVYLDYHLSDVNRLMVFHNATLRSSRVADFFAEVRPMIRSIAASKQSILLRPYYGPVHASASDLDGKFSRKTLIPLHRFSGDYGLSDAEIVYKAQDDISILNLNGAFSVCDDEFMGSRCAIWDREIQRWRWREVLYLPVSDSEDSDEFLYSRYLVSLRNPGSELSLRRKTRRVVVIV